jgi:hypothetical protein
LELLFSNLLFLVGNFTDFLGLQGEEFFVTDSVDVNLLGTEVSVASSVTPSISVIISGVVVTTTITSVVPVFLELFLRNFLTLVFLNKFDVLSEELFVGHLLDVGVLLGIEISVASSVASSIPSVVVGVVVATSVASVVPVGLELFFSNFLFLIGNFTDFLGLQGEEFLVTDSVDVNLLGTEVSVASSITPSISVIISGVVVTTMVTSVVPVSLELLLRNFNTFMLVDKLDVFSEEIFVGHLMNFSVLLGIKIYVTSSVASSIPSVVISVVVATSVTSVVPVGLELLFSNFLFLVGNFTDLLVLKSEELFVT